MPKRIPPQLKILKGNPGCRPIPVGPDLTTEMPKPPKWVTGYALDMWNDMAKSLHEMGMLNLYNAPLFAALCEEVKLYRTAVEQLNILVANKGDLAGLISQTSNGNIIQNPMVGIISKRGENIRRMSCEFGFPPTRMGLPKSKEVKKDGKERFFK